MRLRYRYQVKIATANLELSKMDLVKKFMNHVAKEINVPKEELRFLFKGKIFDQKNNYRLVDYRCENNDLVEVWPCGPQAQQKVEAKKEEDKENSDPKTKGAISPTKCDENGGKWRKSTLIYPPPPTAIPLPTAPPSN